MYRAAQKNNAGNFIYDSAEIDAMGRAYSFPAVLRGSMSISDEENRATKRERDKLVPVKYIRIFQKWIPFN
jgi:hypothetical protein